MNGNGHHHAILQNIAHRAMIERGLLPDFSAQALAELDEIQAPATAMNNELVRDLTHRLWVSIDNDDSHDLDQLTVAEALPGDKIKLLVAIADVDALVKKHGSAVDGHARHNTTSVYTAARIFPMLPEKLSTNLTSLNLNGERMAVVVEMRIGADGSLQDSDIYRARVRNHAQLAYNSVAVWLEGGDAPEEITTVKGVTENLRLQDKAAQKMRSLRHLNGALSLETIEARPIFDGGQIRDLQVEKRNRAKEIIEGLMIAANGVTARYLSSRNFPSIRRVVRTPKRWGRIVELAGDHGVRLPDTPDSKALDKFLLKEKAAAPLQFPDLSLAVIKLLGAGEYVAELPGAAAPGHFGLAVKDYAHSTAPNRRYADLITQRLLKAALAGRNTPYTYAELDVLAQHLTVAEDAANKVERQVGKSAAALLLEERIGESFDAIVTGAANKGTWVRLLTVPVEGKLVSGFAGLDVGDRVRVQLIVVDVQRGFIDFVAVGGT
ncbi:MAG: RNB domain-containing ribonuclease [Anaerolineae bacterium]|nr:RNB domain-containing ribonuclease [Anaerolineae bacterium]